MTSDLHIGQRVIRRATITEGTVVNLQTLADGTPAYGVRMDDDGQVWSGTREAWVEYDEPTPARPTLQEEAERLLSYWERHDSDPEVVARWAVQDLLGILRYITEA